MNNKLSLAIACGITTMCVATTGYSAGHAKAGDKSFNIGGDVELDLTSTDAGDSTTFDHGGRIKINAIGMAHGDNGYFVKGVAQPIVLFNPGDDAITIEQNQQANLTTTTDGNSLEVDDLYFQIGKTNSWDIQMGRFEAINLLPLGKDTLVANVDGINAYSASNVRGRRDDAFHAALHVGSADKFLFELGVQAHKSDSHKTLEVRPAMTYQMGSVKLHAGYEALEDDASGFAIGAGFKLGGGDLNASVAVAEDFVNPVVGKVDVTTIAVNYTKGPWGVGVLNANADRQVAGTGEDPSLTTVYGAYTVPLFGIKDASVTFAGSYSDGTATNNGQDDDLTAVRARFNYTF